MVFCTLTLLAACWMACVMVPAEASPAKVYRQLFVAGDAKSVERQLHELRTGRSILDSVADRAEFRAGKEGGSLAPLHAEKRNYRSQMGNMMTEAGIDAGFLRDLYVSLGEPLGDGSWAVRVHTKPFVRWLWIGGVIMALGGLSTLLDRRYRVLRAADRRAADATLAARA